MFDPEPMPAAVDLFQKLNGDKFFSKIDLSKGYWQVTIPEVDIPKMAFVTPDGSYEFLKMPFSMVNSAATLKRGMKKLLKGMKNVEFTGMISWSTPVHGRNTLRSSASCLGT